MPLLLYIHGFLSSPQSYKAQQLQQWLRDNMPHIEYCCPLLTPYPEECATALISIVERAQQEQRPVYLMGSSLGGFWATYLAERYHLPAILINPAVDAVNLIPQYAEQTLHNYHTDDVYYLKSDDLAQLARYDTFTIADPANYWLLVQTADETLDYRLAVEKYSACKQTVEQGGDHSFQHFDRFHSACIRFFEHHGK